MLQKQLLDTHNNLLTWYEKDGRSELPWRNTSDIYHVYVSEIMLQQTQVSRVMQEYYPKFLERFPTLESLSKASVEEVFALWSGLGYYRRATNLHNTAKLTQKGLPNTQEELLKLPGIGRYTASAICSFGYSQRVSVVDTNIARVLARYFGKTERKEKELWQLADNFLNKKETRSHNLALMDLGSLLCLPKNPKCKSCPLQNNCIGSESPELYYKKKVVNYIDKTLYFGVCVEDEKIAMYTSNDGMYKGMLELASLESSNDSMDLLGTFKHSVTHFRLEIYVYDLKRVNEDVIWIDMNKLDEAPISSLTRKALELYKKESL